MILKNLHFITRNDKKMARILTGLGDGCDSCLAPRSAWNDVEAIEGGFAIDRNYNQIRETWASLPRDSMGELVKKKGDYATRQGLCHPPISLREPTSFSITHKVYRQVAQSTKLSSGGSRVTAGGGIALVYFEYILSSVDEVFGP